jgi:NTP pyrophosphatase (non-canonical NTP hydrolase)
MSSSDLLDLRDLIRVFVEEREWGKFNSPKNLAIALNVEAGELLEPFQWLENGDIRELDQKLEEVEHEIADVFIYLIALADRLQIDLKRAVETKMEINRVKYPTDRVKGNAKKYNEY